MPSQPRKVENSVHLSLLWSPSYKSKIFCWSEVICVSLLFFLSWELLGDPAWPCLELVSRLPSHNPPASIAMGAQPLSPLSLSKASEFFWPPTSGASSSLPSLKEIKYNPSLSLAFVEKKWVERTRKLHYRQVLFHFACLCGCVSEKKEELTKSSSINLWHTYLVAATK